MAPINAVVGDSSYLARFGREPRARDSERRRIRVHLEWIEEQLRAASVKHLAAEPCERRAGLLRALRDYAARECFPRNHYSLERRPVFIDREGRVCAVGHLIELSAGRVLANRIAARHRFDYVHGIQLPEVSEWAAAHGFSLHELAMIQPTYGGEPVTIIAEPVVRLVPATVVVGLALLATVGAVHLARGWHKSRRPDWPRLQLALLVFVAGYGAALWREVIAIAPSGGYTDSIRLCGATFERKLYKPRLASLTRFLIKPGFASSDPIRHGTTLLTYPDGTALSGYFLFGHHVSGAKLEGYPSCSLRHEPSSGQDFSEQHGERE